jgi:hypothetical protein
MLILSSHLRLGLPSGLFPSDGYNTESIIGAVELITPHMLINTLQELEYRLDIYGATTGAHIEVYGRAQKYF